MVEKVEVQLSTHAAGPEGRALRPTSIFATETEVAEADQLHSELQVVVGRRNLEGRGGYVGLGEWEVARTVKNDSNGTEFEIRFGYYHFLMPMHLLKLRLQ